MLAASIIIFTNAEGKSLVLMACCCTFPEASSRLYKMYIRMENMVHILSGLFS